VERRVHAHIDDIVSAEARWRLRVVLRAQGGELSGAVVASMVSLVRDFTLV
jgi:hypothetical protein